MSIYAPRPADSSAICMRIPVNDFEISISCDDNCGIHKDLHRTDLRVFNNLDQDVTAWVFNLEAGHPDVEATVEHLEQAISVCRGAL